MADTRDKTLIRVPEFRKDNIQGYINVLRTWQFVTDMDKKQAPVVGMTLPEDSSNIRDLVTNSIGLEQLREDDKMDKLIELLKKSFQQEEELEAFSKWKEFDNFKREQEEDA